MLPPLPARVVVEWSAERLPSRLVVNGQWLPHHPGHVHVFQGPVRFRTKSSVVSLQGKVTFAALASGWKVAWTTTGKGWVAAATAGETGDSAPFEARRALASVLGLWLQAHPKGNHPDGSLCPLTHCAVVRGMGSPETALAVALAPDLNIHPANAFFTGSKGGQSLSPHEVWGDGPSEHGESILVAGDRWASWTRRLTSAQVNALKRAVPPGLKPGQRGTMLGPSGPYAVESLRLAAGRSFGWTTWPSNACEVSMNLDGSLELRGHGWGHNVGLDLTESIWRAERGEKAESLLQSAFGSWTRPENP